jgi:hypothetical protein
MVVLSGVIGVGRLQSVEVEVVRGRFSRYRVRQ